MHFHLPKPLHGWRDFAGEVGIIVLGVLIALAFEQLAENWRWHQRANEARDALRAEVGQGFLIAEEREASVECIDQQLSRIEAAVVAARSTLKPLPVYGDVIEFTFRAPLRSWPDSAWQGAISDGVTPHLSSRERELLPVYYAQMERVREITAAEEADAGDLLALSKPLPLNPEVQSSFIREIEAERLRNRVIANTDAQLMRTIGSVGFVPEKSERVEWLAHSGTVNFCRAQHFPVGHPEPAD